MKMEIYKNVLCAGKAWPMKVHVVAKHQFRRWSRVDAEGRHYEKAVRVEGL